MALPGTNSRQFAQFLSSFGVSWYCNWERIVAFALALAFRVKAARGKKTNSVLVVCNSFRRLRLVPIKFPLYLMMASMPKNQIGATIFTFPLDVMTHAEIAVGTGHW
jgi:hypothetical protein